MVNHFTYCLDGSKNYFMLKSNWLIISLNVRMEATFVMFKRIEEYVKNCRHIEVKKKFKVLNWGEIRKLTRRSLSWDRGSILLSVYITEFVIAPNNLLLLHAQNHVVANINCMIYFSNYIFFHESRISGFIAEVRPQKKSSCGFLSNEKKDYIIKTITKKRGMMQEILHWGLVQEILTIVGS